MIFRTASRLHRALVLLVLSGLVAGAGVALAASAGASTATLTVTTLDRTGHAAHSQFGVISVHDLRQYYFWTGSAHRLPSGTYDIYAAIPTVGGGDTVGVKRVHVVGTSHVTVDARQGRAVRGYLRPAAPAGFTLQTSVWLCNNGTPAVGGSSIDGPAYVIPSSLPEVEFAFSTVWTSQTPDNHAGTTYAGVSVHHHGAPAGMTRTFLQSGLTEFAVKGRTGVQSGEAQVDVRYAPDDGCEGVALQLFSTATLPYTLTMHVPAGPWWVGQLAQDYIAGPARRYAAGHSYVATVGEAAWGPGGTGGLPQVDPYCRCLITTTNEMFADPALSNGGDARVTYTLRKGRTTIASKTVYPNLSGFTPPLRGRGWYSLTEVATRHPINPLPADVMSPRSALRLHFYADPSRTMQVGGLITRFVPRGLGRDNRARSKTTTVSLGLLRAQGPSSDRSVAKTVRVWMSNDFGHTWRPVPVRNTSGAWSATISNPASGYVSLRATVVDTRSNTATTEIFRAYGVA